MYKLPRFQLNCVSELIYKFSLNELNLRVNALIEIQQVQLF